MEQEHEHCAINQSYLVPPNVNWRWPYSAGNDSQSLTLDAIMAHIRRGGIRTKPDKRGTVCKVSELHGTSSQHSLDGFMSSRGRRC